MTQDRIAKGVVLPTGHTGSSLFHAVLAEAVAEYPQALGGARFPAAAGAFKREYGAALARLESARAASPERAAIARFVMRRTQEALRFAGESGSMPLVEYLRTHAPRPALMRARLSGAAGLPVEVPFEGKLLHAREVLDLVERMYETHQLTGAARAALGWIVEHIAQRGGKLDLRGQRFVLLGAGAELAPTRLLLRAGASVLWVDPADPARSLAGESALSGVLVRAPEASNLLERPREIAAAIAQFAAEGPVHICMFAYAGGASQEWRLGAAMNAITASLDPGLVRSVALLVSPTTASVLAPESVAAARTRAGASPGWQRLLASVGLLRAPGHHQEHGQHVALATVSIQGLSYQAAQYISKIAAAETYAAFGTGLHEQGPTAPLTVSANVAGITRTRSLSHPLFEAAFAGAHHFGVRIFDAATTRALSGLLILHDLLNPAAPGAAATPGDARERAARVHAQQIHGGIYGLPHVLEGVIQAAAVAGLSRKPSLLWTKKRRAPEAAPLALTFVADPAPPTNGAPHAYAEQPPGQ
jgi:hypothetical protein